MSFCETHISEHLKSSTNAMDMSIFQIESNKMKPQAGSILISAPFLRDYHFARSVVLLVEHNDEGSMGIVLNKKFNYQINLDELVPELEFMPKIPVYKGGPVSRDILFYLHTLHELEGAVSLGNGLYLNGNFDQLKQYILDGNPVEGVIRFFTGYAGWDAGQLEKEIEAGHVKINGVVANLGATCDPYNDKVEVNGKALKTSFDEKVYVAIYKPRGFVTTMKDQDGRKTVCDLVKDVKTRIYPVGRLDMVSEGLLERKAYPGDRRKELLVPTEKALPIVETGREAQKKFAGAMLEGLSEEELAVMEHCFQVMNGNIDRIIKSCGVIQGENEK